MRIYKAIVVCRNKNSIEPVPRCPAASLNPITNLLALWLLAFALDVALTFLALPMMLIVPTCEDARTNQVLFLCSVYLLILLSCCTLYLYPRTAHAHIHCMQHSLFAQMYLEPLYSFAFFFLLSNLVALKLYIYDH